MRSNKESRHTSRRSCHGEVLVYGLAGGPPLKGRLADVGAGGVGVALDRPLNPGEAVRLVFASRGGSSSQPGRTIIGRVAHSCRRAGTHYIGIAFGWEAAMRGSATIRRDTPTPGWLRFFSRRRRMPIGSPPPAADEAVWSGGPPGPMTSARMCPDPGLYVRQASRLTG